MSLIQYLSRIRFDLGAISLLGDGIRRLGAGWPLVISDRRVADAGILDRVLAHAGAACPVVVGRTPENPNEEALRDCLEPRSSEGCSRAFSVGEGSVIDHLKGVALISSHGATFAVYEVKVGGSAGIGKVPPALAAAIGIDALGHGIEACLSALENPPADAIALEWVSRIGKWFRIATRDGIDRISRWNMMMAALEGGMVLQKSLGGAHAVATPPEEKGLRRGTLIGVLLPPVLRFNSVAAVDLAAGTEYAVDAKMPLFARVERLVSDLKLPDPLSELGIQITDVTKIAEWASNSYLSATNPCAADEEDHRRLLEAAY